jgi:transposase InsO family protein
MTIQLRQNTFRYQLKRRDDRPVRARIKEIANTRIKYGEERIYKLLRKEGWPDNHKRVRRIYREEALNQHPLKRQLGRTFASIAPISLLSFGFPG